MEISNSHKNDINNSSIKNFIILNKETGKLELDFENLLPCDENIVSQSIIMKLKKSNFILPNDEIIQCSFTKINHYTTGICAKINIEINSNRLIQDENFHNEYYNLNNLNTSYIEKQSLSQIEQNAYIGRLTTSIKNFIIRKSNSIKISPSIIDKKEVDDSIKIKINIDEIESCTLTTYLN